MNRLMEVFNRKITVVHNGMEVEFFDNGYEVIKYIGETIGEHNDLSPKKIVDYAINSETLIIIYKYYTLYEEMFHIEIEELPFD